MMSFREIDLLMNSRRQRKKIKLHCGQSSAIFETAYNELKPIYYRVNNNSSAFRSFAHRGKQNMSILGVEARHSAAGRFPVFDQCNIFSAFEIKMVQFEVDFCIFFF